MQLYTLEGVNKKKCHQPDTNSRQRTQRIRDAELLRILIVIVIEL